MIIEGPGGGNLEIAATVRRMIIDATRNWNALLWNPAAHPQNRPHTENGGCPMRERLAEIENTQVLPKRRVPDSGRKLC
jgi:glucosylceramidase